MSQPKSLYSTIFFTFFNPSYKLSLLLKLKMEGELDTQELKYSMDLDSSSENGDNSSESSGSQDNF